MTSHVASIQSKECSTNVKSVLKLAVSQIIGDDEDDGKSVARKVSPRGLRLWYENQHKTGEVEPIVIILEDFEGFQPSLLHDLIQNLR